MPARLSRALRAALVLSVLSGSLAVAAEPARYVLDPAKSQLEFAFEQAGARNEGRFGKFAVTFDFAADDPAASRLDVVIDMASVDTGDGERDGVLRGKDLFDAEHHPQARFTAVRLEKTAADRYEAAGKLTIRGNTRDVRIPVTFRVADEQGNQVGQMTGEITIRRLDFGVGQGEWKSTEWVGNDVTVSFALRLTPRTS